MATIQVKNPNTGATFMIEESEFASTYQPLGWTKVSDISQQSSQATNPNDIPTSGNGYSNLQVKQIPSYYRYDKNGNLMTDANGQPQEYTTWINFSDGSTLKDSGVPKYKVTYYDINDKAEHSGSLDGFAQKYGITLSSTTNNTSMPTSSSYVYGQGQLTKKANNAAVNTLYQAYFGRNATQAELNNWGEGGGADTTVKALEDFLQKERTTYNVTTPVKTLAEITGQTTTSATTPTSTTKRQIYRIGNDIYDASTNQKIGATDWTNNWSGKSDVEEIAAPSTGQTTTTPPAVPTSTTQTTEYDPYEEALKYGYTRDDFTSDPGFEAYWKNKTPEQLKTALSKRNDWDNTVGTKKAAAVETPEQVDISMYDSIINGDAFLTEQFQDENIKNNFAQMSPTLQMAYLQMLQSLGKTIEAGKVINPDIEITPEKIQEFTDQATSELDPYYQEQIKLYKQDLDTSISRLTEDFTTGIRNAEDPFKRNLEAQAESEAQAGLTYGSERAKRENIAVEEKQQAIDEATKATSRSIEDAYKTAERALGSDAITTSGYLPVYSASKSGINQTSGRTLFTPTGGLTGTLTKEKETAVKSRASELEESYRQQRILNTNI